MKLASYDVDTELDRITVGELIDMLSKFPRDALLVTEDVGYLYEAHTRLHLNVIGEPE